MGKILELLAFILVYPFIRLDGFQELNLYLLTPVDAKAAVLLWILRKVGEKIKNGRCREPLISNLLSLELAPLPPQTRGSPGAAPENAPQTP